jgi:predicted DCC family thiol-disulfide oxidoreductase YuxK
MPWADLFARACCYGNAVKSSAANPEVTVWFDSQCPLCAREIALMKRLDRRGAIDFVDLHTARNCPVDPDELLRRFHAREHGRDVVSGAAAFAAMWRAIPILRPLGLVALFPPVLWVLEGAYRVFLRLRPRLQRLAHRMT